MSKRVFEFVKDNEKALFPATRLPQRATMNSVAYDFYSPIDVVIPPKQACMIWTNVKASFGRDEALIINVRSSMGKNKLMFSNTQAWIESDYYGNPDNDGNIGISLYNYGEESRQIFKGDRIAQGMFIKFLVTDDDNAQAQRVGGWGSSGK